MFKSKLQPADQASAGCISLSGGRNAISAVYPGSSVLLGELACCNVDNVDYPADAEAASGEQPDDAGADLTGHKSVYSELSEENCDK